MKVYVKLFAALTKNVPETLLARYPQGIRAGTPLKVELPKGSTLADLVTNLDLPPEEIKVLFVNGRARKADHRLEPDDEVGIFPPVGGG